MKPFDFKKLSERRTELMDKLEQMVSTCETETRAFNTEEQTQGLETTAQVIRKARGEVMDEMGQELLGGVQRRIGGSGRVAGVQEYKVGSGTGYVAVRAKADTYLDGYAAGYITNSLENGHAIRQPSGTAKRRQKSRARIASVPGKHMYQETRETEAERMAENGAKRIEEAALRHLNGG